MSNFWDDRRLRRSPRINARSDNSDVLKIVPLSEVQTKDRPDIVFGGKIFLPVDQLAKNIYEVAGYDEEEEDIPKPPLLFKLEATFDEGSEENGVIRRTIHCGAWEFTSEPGEVQMPEWMRLRLGTEEVKVTSVRLPKAQSLTIRAASGVDISVTNWQGKPTANWVLVFYLAPF